MAKTRYHYFTCPEAGVTIGVLGDDPKALALRVSEGILRGKPVTYIPNHPSALNERLESGAAISTGLVQGHLPAPRVVESGKVTMTPKGPRPAADAIGDMIVDRMSA